MEVSLVIPLYNEIESIPFLTKAINQVATQVRSMEVIFVDDGSTDATFELLRKQKLIIPKIILQFSRNFGHQAALLAGLREARGKFVVTLDGDLQHPLTLIPKMLAEHYRGVDIVLTQKIDTDVVHTLKKTVTTSFYWLLQRLSSTSIIANSSDFRSMNQQALKALLALPEHRHFLRGMVNWIGFTSITIPFIVPPRVAGQSNYSLAKMTKLAIYGITSFSTIPLYFAGFFSFVLLISAFIYALYVIYVRFATQETVSGWASLLLVLLIIGGFLCFFLGIIGVYIAAIYDEVKERPIYILKQKYR